jgi:hypothetical protein
MIAVVRQINQAVVTDMSRMGSFVKSGTPGAEHGAAAIEHDNWMLATRKRVHIVLSIDRQASHISEGPTFWQLCPLIKNLIIEFTATKNNFVRRLLGCAHDVLLPY